MFQIISGVARFAHTSLDDDVAKLKDLCSLHHPNEATAFAHLSHRAEAKQGIDIPLMINELVLLEVCPGFCVRLRGFEETWPTVVSGKPVLTRCSCCAATLGSIPDAEFVLCPECRFISLAGNNVSFRGGGLGLGINMNKVRKSNQRPVPRAIAA